MERWAFFKDQEDGRWMVVIVGHTERCPPNSGQAEVLDFDTFPAKDAAESWAREQIGPFQIVYHGPN